MKKINDLLQFTPDQYKNIRVKLNMYNGSNQPIERYTKKPNTVNKRWLLWHRNRRYFKENQIAICLVRLPNNRNLWTLTTIQRIKSKIEVENGGVGYKASVMKEYSKHFGTVFEYHNTSRCIGRKYESIMNDLVVAER